MLRLQVTIARGWFARLRGLMGKAPLPPDAALCLPYCRQVHTWFMRFPIDVVFFNAQNVIISVIENLPPWHLSPRVAGAVGCLELTAGGIERFTLRPGKSLPIVGPRGTMIS